MGSIFDIEDTNSINSINLIENGWSVIEKSPGNFVKQISHNERIIYGRNMYKYRELTFIYSSKTQSISFLNAYEDMKRYKVVNSMHDLNKFVNETTIEIKNRIKEQMKKNTD